jgi:hypothetical protein
MVILTVEDVGAFTSIQELVEVNKLIMQTQGLTVDSDSVKMSPSTNSAALIAMVANPLKRAQHSTLC